MPTRTTTIATVLGHPGEAVQIVEGCSGREIRTRLDELGAIPRHIPMPSHEWWEVNVSGRESVGLRPPIRSLADPLAPYGTSRRTGPIIHGRAKAAEVRQGLIGNCYLVASMAAVAHMMPDQIADMITDNGDGTYSVRFYRRNIIRDFEPYTVSVDSDFVDAYEHTPSVTCPSGRAQQELWPAIVQKAWAAWRGDGDYAAIEGGTAREALERLIGRSVSNSFLTRWSANGLWGDISAAILDHRPVVIVAATDRPAAGIIGAHAYTVLDARTTASGDRELLIRNPWGWAAPMGAEPNDGAAWVKVETVARYLDQVTIVDP